MKQQQATLRKNTKVWVNLDRRTLEALDNECRRRGHCTRTSILRMLLMERYKTVDDEPPALVG